ncbi:MAG: hypothetical protein ACI4TG_08420, partial [Ruminococcus sp.]
VKRMLLPLALAEQLKEPIPTAILTLPTFAPDDNPLHQRLTVCRKNGWKDVLCDTTAHLILGKQAGFTLHGGTGLNIANRHSIAVLQQFGVQDTLLSVELTARQGLSCNGILPIGVFAYGYFPVMKTRLCPIREEVGCRSCSHTLTDRTGRQFPVFCMESYAVLYNAVPVWMADKLEMLQGFSTLLLSFSVESEKQVYQVLRAYQHPGSSIPSDYTRGLLLRGLPSAVQK